MGKVQAALLSGDTVGVSAIIDWVKFGMSENSSLILSTSQTSLHLPIQQLRWISPDQVINDEEYGAQAVLDHQRGSKREHALLEQETEREIYLNSDEYRSSKALHGLFGLEARKETDAPREDLPHRGWEERFGVSIQTVEGHISKAYINRTEMNRHFREALEMKKPFTASVDFPAGYDQEIVVGLLPLQNFSAYLAETSRKLEAGSDGFISGVAFRTWPLYEQPIP